MINIALYQPDIALNLGTTIRSCACFGVKLHIIEPCGFPFNKEKFRRSSMDYIDHVDIIRHISWDDFKDFCIDENLRIILATTKCNLSYTDFKFKNNNIILMGRETAGVPDFVNNYCNYKVTIKMQQRTRSLNVAVSTAIILSEAIRQVSL